MPLNTKQLQVLYSHLKKHVPNSGVLWSKLQALYLATLHQFSDFKMSMINKKEMPLMKKKPLLKKKPIFTTDHEINRTLMIFR